MSGLFHYFMSAPTQWIALILTLCAHSVTHAQHLAIPESGAVQFASIGLANGLRYQELALSENPGLSLTGGYSNQGFSASAWYSESLTSSGYFTELLAAYSHKLPVVDAHFALVACHMAELGMQCENAVRLAVSTNGSHSTVVRASVDIPFSGAGNVLALSAEHTVLERDNKSVAVRWGWSRFESDLGNSFGTSVRVICKLELAKAQAIHLSAGYIESRLYRPAYQKVEEPVIDVNFLVNF